MECPMCLEQFNQDARRPKVLPCGHTACLACLLQLKQRNCPTCRKGLPKGRVDALPDNYIVMANLTGRDRQRERRWWCSTCRVVAKDSCEFDGHHLLRPSTALRLQVAQVQEQLPQLQQEVHEQLQALAAAADTAEDKALAGLQCLGGRGLTCKLEVCRDGEPSYGAKWCVSESALKDKLLRALALVLVQDGELTQQEKVQAGCSGPQQGGQLRAAQSSTLWRLKEVPRGPVVTKVPEEAGLIDDLDVRRALRTENKASLLQRVRQQGVRRMTNVWCESHYAWKLQLLQCAAPTLEELQVLKVSPEQMSVVLTSMPRLRRLRVQSCTGNLNHFPWSLPPLPAHHAGLQCLHVDLPLWTIDAMLKAHGRSLQELGLYLGTGYHRAKWPSNCEEGELPALLQPCGLRALKRLVLWRPPMSHNSAAECRHQRETVRRAMHGVTVLCKQCDGVFYKF